MAETQATGLMQDTQKKEALTTTLSFHQSDPPEAPIAIAAVLWSVYLKVHLLSLHHFSAL